MDCVDEIENKLFITSETDKKEIERLNCRKAVYPEEVFREGDIIECPAGPYAFYHMSVKWVRYQNQFQLRACLSMSHDWGIEIRGCGWKLIRKSYGAIAG